MDASIVHLQTHLPFLATRHGIQLARRIGKDLAYHTVVQSGERVFDALTGAEGMQWQDYQNLFYENAFEDGTIQIVRNLDKEEGDD